MSKIVAWTYILEGVIFALFLDCYIHSIYIKIIPIIFTVIFYGWLHGKELNEDKNDIVIYKIRS